jgi:hypothetical protein
MYKLYYMFVRTIAAFALMLCTVSNAYCQFQLHIWPTDEKKGLLKTIRLNGYLVNKTDKEITLANPGVSDSFFGVYKSDWVVTLNKDTIDKEKFFPNPERQMRASDNITVKPGDSLLVAWYYSHTNEEGTYTFKVRHTQRKSSLKTQWGDPALIASNTEVDLTSNVYTLKVFSKPAKVGPDMTFEEVQRKPTMNVEQALENPDSCFKLIIGGYYSGPMRYLEKFKNVRWLEMVGNVDSIPAEWADNKLVYVSMSCEKDVYFPPSFGGCQMIEEFKIEKGLTKIPDWVYKQDKLRKISITSSTMSTIGPAIGNLINLKDLYIYNCRNIKTLPQEFSRLKSLETFTMTQCMLQSLENVKNLPSLKMLDVSFNKMKTITESISTLTALTKLDAGLNEITTFPATPLPATLKWLNISSNKLTELPASVFEGQVENLIAGYNQLTGLPEIKTPNTYLKVMFLNSVPFPAVPESIPTAFPELKKLSVATKEKKNFEKDKTVKLLRAKNVEVLTKY